MTETNYINNLIKGYNGLEEQDKHFLGLGIPTQEVKNLKLNINEIIKLLSLKNFKTEITKRKNNQEILYIYKN